MTMLTVIDAVRKVLGAAWFRYAALGVLCFGLLLRGTIYHRQAAHWREAYQTQKTAIVATQAAAAAKAEQQRLATENRYSIAAERADHATAIADTLRARADAYRRLHLAGSEAASGGPAAAAAHDPATGGDGPGVDAVVVARTDYDQLVGNTARLEAVHEWGAELVAKGLAAPLEGSQPGAAAEGAE